MEHFRTINNALTWLDQHTSGRRHRALSDGKVEWLGGFSHIPPSYGPGWIVRCISSKGFKYDTAIVLRKLQRPAVYGVVKIPWKYWNESNSVNPLFCGHRPKLYLRIKQLDEFGSQITDKGHSK
jgi:hypothetical protein